MPGTPPCLWLLAVDVCCLSVRSTVCAVYKTSNVMLLGWNTRRRIHTPWAVYHLLSYLVSYFLLSLTFDCRVPDGCEWYLCDARCRQPAVDRCDGVVRQYVPDANRHTELR